MLASQRQMQLQKTFTSSARTLAVSPYNQRSSAQVKPTTRGQSTQAASWVTLWLQLNPADRN